MISRNENKILIVGDLQEIFIDSAYLPKFPFETRTNVLDAIETVSQHKYSIIAVAISGLSGRLDPVLKVLKENAAGAKIILLAKMHEEALAKSLTNHFSNGTGNLDYLIYPVQMQKFEEVLFKTEPGIETFDGKLVARINQLEKIATTDELTNLKNRRYLWEFCRQIIDLEKNRNGRVTLLVFDIDDFKTYNDRFGHAIGDIILKQAAVLMQRSCRNHDVVGRIGGDEFAVVFWDGPDKKLESNERRVTQVEHPQEAIFISKRFQKELETAELNLLGSKGKGVLSISGGLASFPRDGTTVEELFKQADEALFEAKRHGKNRIYLVGSAAGDISNIK